MPNKNKGGNKGHDNLIPAKKGEVRNPNGRPKKSETYSDTLRELLQGQDIEVTWTVNGKKKNLTVTSDKNLYYGVASAQIMSALKGDTKAAKEIIDRIQGKPPQGIDITTQGDKITEAPLTDQELTAIADALDKVQDEPTG